MPRFQRKLILLVILITFFVIFLLLQNLHVEERQIVQDEIEGPRVIRLTIRPYGKKEDQHEVEASREEIQEVSTMENTH